MQMQTRSLPTCCREPSSYSIDYPHRNLFTLTGYADYFCSRAQERPLEPFTGFTGTADIIFRSNLPMSHIFETVFIQGYHRLYYASSRI